MTLNWPFIKELAIGFFMIICASVIVNLAIIAIDERKAKTPKEETIEPIEDLEIVKTDNGFGVRIVRGKITKSPIYMFTQECDTTPVYVSCTSPTTGYIEYYSNRKEKAFRKTIVVPFKIYGDTIVYDLELEKESNEK
jgi:hypothetical protein